MNDVFYEKLRIIWDAIKEHCVCLCQGGSSEISFIQKPGDIDIIFLYTSNEEGREARKILHTEYIKQIRKDLKDNYNTSLFGRRVSELQKMYYWSYQPFEFLFNTSCEYKDFPVLEHKEEYVKVIRKNQEIGKKYYTDKNKISKFLYHSLIIYYYMLNNSYELTEEQINNVNLAHDAVYSTDEQEIQQAVQLMDWLDEEISKL